MIINALFLLKYSSGQDIIPTSVVLIIYALLIFFGGVVLLTFIGINMSINGESLNVDRWSALEIFIENILNSNYPYNLTNHLKQTSSNLPALFYLGLPFYLLGDVGYLQCFTFMIVVFWLHYAKFSNYYKALFLFLLLLSPAYLWEVFVKSDLMSNLFLLVVFIDFWRKKYKNNLFETPVLLAFFCAFFMLTRGIVLIPLILFLFKEYLTLGITNKLKFFFFSVVFLLVISIPVLLTIPHNYDVIFEHNPFNHQVKYTSDFFIAFSLLLAFVLAYKSRRSKDVFYYSLMIFTGLMFSTLLINIYSEGFAPNIYGDLFDLSYIGICIPFIIFTFRQ